MDDEIDPKSVWVTNIPYNITEEQVIKKFGVCGKIDKIDLPQGKKHIKKAYAFIHFAEEKAAAQAIAEFNLTDLGGRSIRLRHGFKPKSSSGSSKYYDDDPDQLSPPPPSNQRPPSPRGDYMRSRRDDYPPSPPKRRSRDVDL